MELNKNKKNYRKGTYVPVHVRERYHKKKSTLKRKWKDRQRRPLKRKEVINLHSHLEDFTLVQQKL